MMGNFFYQGQKDAIRRLNELAGRGAVVSSYAPAVGRSPLGGPNGYMDPAWLDPSMPFKAGLPISIGSGFSNKYGYNFVHGGDAQRFFKIATLRAMSSGTHSSLRLDGIIGGWQGATLTALTAVIGSREAATLDVDWTNSKYSPTIARFVAYKESDGAISVYLVFLNGVFAQASFQLMGMDVTTYATPVAISTPTGTLVWDSGAIAGQAGYRPPRIGGPDARLNSSLVGTGVTYHMEVRSANGSYHAASFLRGGSPQDALTAGQEAESLRLGISGQSGINYDGHMSFLLSSGNRSSLYAQGYKLAIKAADYGSNNWTAELFSVNGVGHVYMPLLKAGSTNTGLQHNISRGTAEGDQILYVGTDAAPFPSVWVAASNGQPGWSFAPAVLHAGKNSTTNRSINVPGTVNTNGNDYAEYIFKGPECGVVAPGQIVGITAENKVTDKWADAVMFSIKSTAPSFVGGDSWGNDIGPRPQASAGAAPIPPMRREDVLVPHQAPCDNPPECGGVVTEPGDTDDEWAEKQATYTAALVAHNIAVQQDAEAMAAFDAALEVERQKVDRIAIAGRVPVNVQGAQPGDYIVPVQDGDGIQGIPVRQADLGHLQYLQAVGRVISIEPDGRAYVMVKVV